MTDAPDMEPAALEAAIATHDRILALPATPDDQKLIAEIIRAYLAARSVPEAGKVVDENVEVQLTAGSPSRGAVAPSSVGIESGPANQDAEQARMERENEAFHKWWEESGHAAEPIYTLTAENACHAAWQARAALASVPAPSGAEPLTEALTELRQRIAASQSQIEPEFAEALYSNRSEMYRTFPAPQAVPAEDVARIIEDLKRCGEFAGATALTSLSARLAERGMQLNEAHAAFHRADARATASEAEATTLRRKLEEHRRALEPFIAVAELLNDSLLNHETHWSAVYDRITVGDLRRARTLSGASE